MGILELSGIRFEIVAEYRRKQVHRHFHTLYLSQLGEEILLEHLRASVVNLRQR